MDDPEIQALGLIAKALTPLSDDQIRNVLVYVHSRYGGTHLVSGPPAADPLHSAAQPDEPLDLGDLFERSNPITESERVLVAAYWLQSQTDSKSFESYPVNKELKQLGYSISNITRAIDSLIDQDPSLVIQVGKSGKTQQARKQYKLTREGRREVRKMADLGVGVPPAKRYVGPTHAVLRSGFSNKIELSPKQFLNDKQPQTDVERIACLAYYLAHYRDQTHFKTVDLSRLNTEAAQLKFSNTGLAASNAARRGLITVAGKALRQISAVGELFVDALPDREAAKQTLSRLKPRKNNSAAKKKTK